MRKGLLTSLALIFTVPSAVALWDSQGKNFSYNFLAFAEPVGLLSGCTDVPEAVVLADELNKRSLRIERYMTSIETQKAELAEATATLQEKLVELKAQKSSIQNRRKDLSQSVTDDVTRLVALYDQMKPDEAAAILTNLPSDFAAEILLRVRPETGARIIAAVEPRRAAVLTAEIGARSVRKP